MYSKALNYLSEAKKYIGNDEIYLEKIKALIPDLIDLTRPDFVFYLSGVDILGTDKLGRLDLSIEGCRKRDQIVFEILYKKGIQIQCSNCH